MPTGCPVTLPQGPFCKVLRAVLPAVTAPVATAGWVAFLSLFSAFFMNVCILTNEEEGNK